MEVQASIACGWVLDTVSLQYASKFLVALVALVGSRYISGTMPATLGAIGSLVQVLE